MMARLAARRGPNAAALARAVRGWRAAGRLDEIAELQVALATESASWSMTSAIATHRP
jgi:hypothetical protein